MMFLIVKLEVYKLTVELKKVDKEPFDPCIDAAHLCYVTPIDGHYTSSCDSCVLATLEGWKRGCAYTVVLGDFDKKLQITLIQGHILHVEAHVVKEAS